MKYLQTFNVIALTTVLSSLLGFPLTSYNTFNSTEFFWIWDSLLRDSLLWQIIDEDMKMILYLSVLGVLVPSIVALMCPTIKLRKPKRLASLYITMLCALTFFALLYGYWGYTLTGNPSIGAFVVPISAVIALITGIMLYRKIKKRIEPETPEEAQARLEKIKVTAENINIELWVKSTRIICVGVALYCLSPFFAFLLKAWSDVASFIGGGFLPSLSFAGMLEYPLKGMLIVGVVIYFLGLWQFRNAVYKADRGDVNILCYAVILLCIGSMVDFIPLPFIGWIVGIINIIALILMLKSFIGLKRSQTFPEPAQKGASKLLVAAILTILTILIGWIPLIGGDAPILSTIAVIFIFSGWITIAKAVREYMSSERRELYYARKRKITMVSGITLLFLVIGIIIVVKVTSNRSLNRSLEEAESVSIRIGNIIVADRNVGAQQEGIAYNYSNDENHVDNQHSYFKGETYTWEEAQNVCPTGWRLPTKSELEAIIDRLEYSSGRVYLTDDEGRRCYFPMSGGGYIMSTIGYYWAYSKPEYEYQTIFRKRVAISINPQFYLNIDIYNTPDSEPLFLIEDMSKKFSIFQTCNVRCVKTAVNPL